MVRASMQRNRCRIAWLSKVPVSKQHFGLISLLFDYNMELTRAFVSLSGPVTKYAQFFLRFGPTMDSFISFKILV